MSVLSTHAKEYSDDLTALPYVGPDTERILQQEGFSSYKDLADTDPIRLHQKCNIGLANTAGIISTALELLEEPCQNCGEITLKPIWGGYPGQLSDEKKSNNRIFCGSCHWIGSL
jgi:hypothetical protein